ncbi:GNAT family N-acetyltransferase [Massilia rhizosphaerae]|uniref:GNAT family N-acetyltransferase n=1 Tax=Massilia rhizosphaerae TaxID=2784389 RepID=UPI0018DE545C|nr:GNAT family N-acetyltransferase [Massilia rhizosphaerae]
MTCRVRRLSSLTDPDIEGLAAVLFDCVEGGASVGFMQPFTLGQALAWWRGLAADVEAGKRLLLVAEDEHGIVGTVHLVLAMPDNQPHRADLCKMLVMRRARKQGVGAALMDAAEREARVAGKTLLVLDTSSPDAERLYARMGWAQLGVVPGFALWPEGGLCNTTYFYRQLT